jgi:hypothetical protein
MEELAKKLAGYLGDPYVSAVGYGALAYSFFHWLDEKASDDAKSLLARTMRLKDYKSEQVASALVEVFDRIYTYPLWRWRAFFWSVIFTTAISVIFLFELSRNDYYLFSDPHFHCDHWRFPLSPIGSCSAMSPAPELGVPRLTTWPAAYLFGNYLMFGWADLVPALLFNVLTDYLSLFVIRAVLLRSGTRPVISLALGALSAVAIVVAADHLRSSILLFKDLVQGRGTLAWDIRMAMPNHILSRTFFYAWPALAVFIWLPLFALGIVFARLLAPLSWIVGRTQWFLKDGKEHPLKAIGYVAAVAVFLCMVVGRAVFT